MKTAKQLFHTLFLHGLAERFSGVRVYPDPSIKWMSDALDLPRKPDMQYGTILKEYSRGSLMFNICGFLLSVLPDLKPNTPGSIDPRSIAGLSHSVHMGFHYNLITEGRQHTNSCSVWISKCAGSGSTAWLTSPLVAILAYLDERIRKYCGPQKYRGPQLLTQEYARYLERRSP